MSVTLAMIALDEEKLLPRCLDAAADLYDELIVVVDGRTTDATREIVVQYGGRAIPFEVEAPGHKGRARNLGLDAATGDWIVVLDADEMLRDAAGLRAWLEQAPAGISGAQLCFENYDEARPGTQRVPARCSLRWHQLRAWRRGLYRYLYREHEVPLPCRANTEYAEVMLDAMVEHRPEAAPEGLPKGLPGKTRVMLERLLADVAQWPDHAHPAYFLHRQYAILGEWAQCLEAGRHYLEIAGDNDRCECYGNLAIAATNLGDSRGAIALGGGRAAAIEWLHRAAAAQPQRRTWWVRLAQLYVDLEQWNVASAILHCALELLPNDAWQSEPVIEHDLLYELLMRCQQALAHGAAHAHEHGG